MLTLRKRTRLVVGTAEMTTFVPMLLLTRSIPEITVRTKDLSKCLRKGHNVNRAAQQDSAKSVCLALHVDG